MYPGAASVAGAVSSGAVRGQEYIYGGYPTVDEGKTSIVVVGSVVGEWGYAYSVSV